MKGRMKSRSEINISSAAVFMYFFSMLLVNQNNGSIYRLLYYTVITACTVVFVYKNGRITYRFMALLTAVMCLTVVNHVLVGNLTYTHMFVYFTAFFIALLFIDEKVSSKVYLTAVLMNAAVVVFHVATEGFGHRVYVNSSNNYISVHLLTPLVMYYIAAEKEKRNISLVPAFICWVLSSFGGRGGFISLTLLLGALFLYKYVRLCKKLSQKIALVVILIMIALPAVITLSPALIARYSSLAVVERFINKGFDGAGRLTGWEEYMQSLHSFRNLVFGTRIRKLTWASRFNGNLHNSFLFIHAYMGAFGIVFVFVCLVRNTVYSVKNKKWIYLISLTAFCVRSFTDHVFGCNRITPVFIFLLLYPQLLAINEKRAVFLKEYSAETRGLSVNEQ
ncbi:MAG: hypothetical protein IJ806_01315 [Ruminococcus sp.]|nr:hypothetical protein [Ruminococcus sp.]